jgi:hypothetical protein
MLNAASRNTDLHGVSAESFDLPSALECEYGKNTGD